MNPYPTTYAPQGGSSHIHHPPLQISRFDAELQWEANRAQMRAELEGLPTSSFARTMFHEDDRFYATFPDARRAAIDLWISEHMQHGRYIPSAPQNGYFVPAPSLPPAPPLAHTQQVLSPANHATQDNAHAYHLVPRSSSLQLNYSYGNGLDNRARVSVSDDPRPLTRQGRHGVARDDYHHLTDDSMQSFRHSSPHPESPEIIHLAPHLLVPTQGHAGVQLPTVVNSLHHADLASSPAYSDTADSPPCSPVSIYQSLSSSVSPFSSSSAFQPAQFTGDWVADAIATEKILYAPQPSRPEALARPSLLSQDTSPTDTSPRHSHLMYRTHRSSGSRSHPYSSSTSRSPSRSRAATPQPSQPQPRKSVKQARGKDGKPLLACFFCRGRKIACGPGSLGGESSTCNQCERRNLRCKYPVENRRGMRKAKGEGDDEEETRQTCPEKEDLERQAQWREGAPVEA
ncbi:hypothetical protein FPV67DRAFT_510941 [Lyophyllum atratum]|nr:hypothetical protein FPV67DRAFT_510941 [Lyophyllum atratum]